MKIKKRELVKIIKEEVERALATEEQLPRGFNILKVLEMLKETDLDVKKLRKLSKMVCKNKDIIKAAINAGQLMTIVELFGPEEIQQLLQLGKAILRKGTIKEIEEWLKTPEGKEMAIQGLEMACKMSDLGGMLELPF